VIRTPQALRAQIADLQKELREAEAAEPAAREARAHVPREIVSICREHRTGKINGWPMNDAQKADLTRRLVALVEPLAERLDGALRNRCVGRCGGRPCDCDRTVEELLLDR